MKKTLENGNTSRNALNSQRNKLEITKTQGNKWKTKKILILELEQFFRCFTSYNHFEAKLICNKLNKFNFQSHDFFPSYWIACLASTWGHCLVLLHLVWSHLGVVLWWPAHFWKEPEETWICGRRVVCVGRAGRYEMGRK